LRYSRAMKQTLLVSLVLLSNLALGESTLSQSIRCTGQLPADSKRGTTLWVNALPLGNTLEISFFSGPKPEPLLTQSLRVTRVLPMFPIYSVTASVDHRRTGGSLVVANLAIQNEVATKAGQPATLTLESTPVRTGKKTTEKYRVTCRINSRT